VPSHTGATPTSSPSSSIRASGSTPASASSIGGSSVALGGQGGGALSPLANYGGESNGATPAGRARRAQTREAERKLRDLVQSLRGCLASLPERLRLVLELRTGVGVSQALQPGAIASYLHIPLEQLAPLQKSALKRLRTTASTGQCAQPTQSQPELFLASYTQVGDLPTPGSGGSGGVQGATYSKSPGPLSTQASGGGSQLGVALARHAGSAFFWILIAAGSMVLLMFLLADGLGTGPRNRHWRSRWIATPARALRNLKPRR
jgi:hypothetical protein